MALPFEPERVIDLFKFIVRGVLFYLWNVRLTADHFCEVHLLASDGQKFFDRFMQMQSKARVTENFGNGTVMYDGIQGVDSETISVWRFSLYGGFVLVDPGEESVQIGALTGPKRVAERTELYAKWAAGKGPGSPRQRAVRKKFNWRSVFGPQKEVADRIMQSVYPLDKIGVLKKL
jgi:hypothetical protein